jgi:MFS family permease
VTAVQNIGWWRASRYPVFVASRLISQSGDMAAVTALTVHIYATKQSAVAVGALFVVRVLPRILGLFAGAVGDRLELRRLLIICDVSCGALFLAIALIDAGYLALLALVFFAECSATVAMPAARTMVGRTVSRDHLASANAMLSAAIAIGFAAGSALGGVVAGQLDYRWALVGNVVSFLVSASLVALLPAAVPELKTRTTGFVTETFAGLQALRTNPSLLPVFIGFVGVSLAAATDRPALVVLVRDNLHAPSMWYGFALGGVALGAFAASLSAMRYKRIDAKVVMLFRVGIFAQAAGHLAVGLSPVVGVLMLGTLVVGYGNGLEAVYGHTLVQRGSPKESLGVLTGLLVSGTFLADAFGSAVGGIAVELITAPATFVVAATAMVLCGLFSMARQERNREV